MKRFFLSLCLALAGMISLPALSTDGFARETIRYVGSSTVGKFIKAASETYSGARFTIDTRPESSGGERAMARGLADLGGVAREVDPGILNLGVKKFLIGKDAIGVWVNKANPVTALTPGELRDIFSGKITNWSQVGGNDEQIKLYIVKRDSATRKVFTNTIMGAARYSRTVSVARPDEAIIDKVAANAGGIGHLSFALGNTHPKAALVKKINIGNQEASVNNSGYPITRPLYLITKGEPQGAVKAFIDWSLSTPGQEVVKKYFVGR